MNTVKDLMTKAVVTIPENMGIEQICKILCSNSLSGVPVLNDKSRLVGFVSERDVITTIATGDYADKCAKDIMCKKCTTVKVDATLVEVSKIFADKPFRHLPVVKKGEVIGIISRRDVIGKLLKL